MAPAALKGAVIAQGFTCAAIDLNATVVKHIKDHPNRLKFLEFFYFEQVLENAEDDIIELFDLMVDEIMKHGPRVVGLSLLSYQCQHSAKWLAFRLKQRHPEVQVIIGGTGIVGQLASSDQSYCDYLKEQKLIDHYIRGDAEYSLIEFLKGNLSFPGINSPTWDEITDLDSLEYPNYDDYDFSIYESPFIGVLGSRGCVRQCTFCDVHEYWTKFKWRTGESIFNEMLYQNRKHGTRFFKFQDSLINGNVKEYTTLITLLAEHNTKNPENSFQWSSYFIFRPKAHMSEEMWRLTALSGAYILSVGIENLVDKNRYHIKKKFNNDDLEFSLAMAKKYSIKIFFILMVGYVTETDEDHQETLQWVRDHAHYAKDPIHKLSVGGTLAILPNTWLYRNQKELGVTWEDGEETPLAGKNHLWSIRSTNNTYQVRVSRLNELATLSEELGFTVHRAIIDPQKELENLMHHQMKKYYAFAS